MVGIIDRLSEFLENEARLCSMDFWCVTPEYVYRMWGEQVSIEEIENGFTELRKLGYTSCGFTEMRNTLCVE